MVFWLILAISAASCQFSRFLQILLDQATATDLCLVFAIELHCQYPGNEEWNHPRNYF